MGLYYVTYTCAVKHASQFVSLFTAETECLQDVAFLLQTEKKLDTTHVYKFKTKMVISAEGSVFRKMINVKKTS